MERFFYFRGTSSFKKSFDDQHHIFGEGNSVEIEQERVERIKNLAVFSGLYCLGWQLENRFILDLKNKKTC